MVIDRNSWHYKYIAACGDTRYRINLCSYMRGFVKATTIYCWFALLIIAALYLSVCGVLGWFFNYPEGSLQWLLWVAFQTLVAIGVLAFITDKLVQYVQNKHYNRVPVYTPPNPFIQWVKDKHNKVCRMVEFK